MSTAPLLSGLLTNRKVFKEGWSASMDDSANHKGYSNPYPKSVHSEHMSFFKGYMAAAKSVGVSDAKCDAKLTYTLPKPYAEGSFGRTVYDSAHRKKIKQLSRFNSDASIQKPLLKFYTNTVEDDSRVIN